MYVKCDRFNLYSRVFDFGNVESSYNVESSDNVYLANLGTTSTIGWLVRTQLSQVKWLYTSNWDSSAWNHVVVTVSGTTMKVYKNGVLAGTKTDGHEPNILTRTQQWFGRSARSSDGYFNGTIAYVKVWHGVELQPSDVTSLYGHWTALQTIILTIITIVINLVIIFPVYEKCKAYFRENNKVQLIMFSILLVVNLVNYILARVLYSRTYTIIMLCLMIGFLGYFCYKNWVKILE